MNLTEYTINDKIYIDIKEVRASCKRYCKGTRSIAQLIERKGFRDIVYGQIKDGAVEITLTMSRQRGTTFINKEELSELFVDDTPVIPPAPPIIDDKDLIFFKDVEGNEYDVSMRGDRTRKGILFKVKDVERVFRMNRLVDHIIEGKSSYRDGCDYKWFILPIPHAAGNQQDGRCELYLTYDGLMRVIYRSNSGAASEFRDWIDECVFSMNWGTQEQKVKVVARALNADAEHLKAIMSSCPSAITCLYLIDIGNSVFKYGFTKDIQRRFKEHMKTYGSDIKLDTFILIPELDLSKAEATFRRSISAYQYTEMDGRDELISLNGDAYKNVQTIFSTITQMYCGNFKTQLGYYDSKIKDFEAQLLLKDERCGRLLAEQKLIAAEKDSEIYQLRIQMLEMQLNQQ